MREAILKIAAEHRRAWPARLAALLPARFRPYLTHAGAWARVPWAAVSGPAVTAPIPEPIPHQEDRHG